MLTGPVCSTSREPQFMLGAAIFGHYATGHVCSTALEPQLMLQVVAEIALFGSYATGPVCFHFS